MFKYIIFVMIAVGSYSSLNEKFTALCGPERNFEQSAFLIASSLFWPIIAGRHLVAPAAVTGETEKFNCRTEN